MTFKEYFFYENRLDPDDLWNEDDPNTITFTLIPKYGYIYTNNQDSLKNVINIRHDELYNLKGQLVGKNKLKIEIPGFFHEKIYRNTYFHLLPGITFAALRDRIPTRGNPFGKSNSYRVIDGRLLLNHATFWCAKKTFLNQFLNCLIHLQTK